MEKIQFYWGESELVCTSWLKLVTSVLPGLGLFIHNYLKPDTLHERSKKSSTREMFEKKDFTRAHREDNLYITIHNLLINDIKYTQYSLWMSDCLQWLRTVHFPFCFPFICVITLRRVVCSIFGSSFLVFSFLWYVRNIWWFIDKGKQKWIPVFRGGNIFGNPLLGWFKSVCHDFPEYFLAFLIAVAAINTSKTWIRYKTERAGNMY